MIQSLYVLLEAARCFCSGPGHVLSEKNLVRELLAQYSLHRNTFSSSVEGIFSLVAVVFCP